MMKTFLILIALSSLLCGCKPAQTDLHADALKEIQSVITNSVVGYYRTINVNLRDHDPNPELWTADATVEHFTKAGTMERETVYFECVGTNLWVENSSATSANILNK